MMMPPAMETAPSPSNPLIPVPANMKWPLRQFAASSAPWWVYRVQSATPA